ncbi:radical SAM protein [Streptomyces sp. NPDC056291]|uniref:radical SAM protein n=1 Tax=Streptomyces sp. NPDC056291 TaxID=3345772 RepID=UPI0035DBCB55
MPSTLTTPTTTGDDEVWLPLEDTDHTAAVSVVLKLRGETCDIDCLYCFEKRKLAPGGAQITPEQVQRLGEIFGTRPLAIELHGGEPLTVGKPAMAALLDALAAQPTVHQVHLQTNGVRLDTEWLDLFDAHYPNLHIGISMDGDEQGNSWRVGYDGQPVYPHIVRALNLLAERGRTCGIVTVVTPAVLGRAAAVIDHIAAFPAVRAVHLLPAFDTTVTRHLPTAGRRTPPSRRLQADAVHADGADWAVTPAQYATFVLDAAAQWIQAGHFRRIKLDPVVAAIRRLKGLDTAHCHFAPHKCSHVFTAYPDGRFGSCDELPWPQALLAPLAATRSEADVTAAQQANPLLAQGRELMAKCASCRYRTVCGGGCTATRWRMLKATGSDDAYCEHRARLIDGVAHLLAAPDHPDGAHCLRAHWSPAAAGPAPYLGQGEELPSRVRPLAGVLADSWDAIAYAIAPDEASISGPVPSDFGIGVLPRDRAEYAVLAARLCRVIAATDGYLPPAVTAQLTRTHVPTGRRDPVLELSLAPAHGATRSAYLAGLDQAARAFTHAARHSARGGGCACAVRPPRAPREL